MLPSTENLVEAWVTLYDLHALCIDGTLIDRRFDTPSAVTGARHVIEQELENRLGKEAHSVLWDAYDKRNAEVQV